LTIEFRLGDDRPIAVSSRPGVCLGSLVIDAAR
jgi:hypothetical protein